MALEVALEMQAAEMARPVRVARVPRTRGEPRPPAEVDREPVHEVLRPSGEACGRPLRVAVASVKKSTNVQRM